MKRLLCIIDSMNVGGAETFLMKVLRCLPPEEYQFDFLLSKEEGVYVSEILERGGKVYTVPPRRQDLKGALKQIASIVKENQYHYVFRLGDEPIVGLDLLAAKRGGAKRIAFRSCNALTGLSMKSRIINALMRPVLNWVTDVKIAPSTLAAEFTFGKRGARDTHILHNGVNLKQFHFDPAGREAVRAEFGLQDKLVLGHIGRYNKQKNHRYLLEVFREVCRQRDDAVLLVIGTGEDEELIRGWIREFALEDRVLLAGQRFDIPQVLSAMDVFVFPSLHEGMPNTVIEAQATGLPCIIADTITTEANITGLVRYLPLTEDVTDWVSAVMEEANRPRREDTTADFQAHGYDIACVAKELLDQLGMTGDLAN